MVIGAFPAAKLGVLAIKQISKPIANIIKSKAKEHPVFRNYVCMPPAQRKWIFSYYLSSYGFLLRFLIVSFSLQLG